MYDIENNWKIKICPAIKRKNSLGFGANDVRFIGFHSHAIQFATSEYKVETWDQLRWLL